MGAAVLAGCGSGERSERGMDTFDEHARAPSGVLVVPVVRAALPSAAWGRRRLDGTPASDAKLRGSRSGRGMATSAR